jgi:allantoinase
VQPAAVVVTGERISHIIKLQLPIDGAKLESSLSALQQPATGSVGAAFHVEHLGDLVIAPGLVDTHVHVNEPGNTDWEGFETATKAAAAGGVTTIVDMPLNSVPVTIDERALQLKLDCAAGKCWVDVGFHGGLVAGSAPQVGPLLERGVLAIKAFLCHSGLDEFPNSTLADLQAASAKLQEYDRPLFVHAELTDFPAPQPAAARRYAEYLATRPPEWESAAINMLIDFSRETGCKVHVVHLANADALPAIEAAKTEGLPITVETCPHYLHFEAAEIPDGATQYKCAPPIRDRRHREALWAALRSGLIDTIGSDHSPCPPPMKRLDAGDFMQAWGGIASLQLTLPIVWTSAARRGIPLEDIFRWTATNPARLVGFAERKGRIAEGCDADLVVWDPDAEWKVDATRLHHRHKVTPYDGLTVRGVVRRTFVRGIEVYRHGSVRPVPTGKAILAEL